MTELLVGTKKGLFLLEGEPGAAFEIKARAFAGEPVDFATRDSRTGRLLATVTSPFYGPKIFYTDGDPDAEWEQADGIALPEGGDQALERIWVIAPGEADGTLYAGGDPGALFESHDGGSSWELNAGLWEQPSRPQWQPGGGGLCLHSICTWPGYLPEEALKDENAGRCVHHVERALEQPERLFMQFHGGVYRSDDAGQSWNDVGGGGLPSDFGFPLMVDPADPDSAYVIPLVADLDRVTPDGRVRVYETRDAGSSWSPRGDGLPAEHAYLTVLRLAFSRAGRSDQLELYFGATSGDLFGSGDAGATWSTVATRLPPVFSVVAR